MDQTISQERNGLPHLHPDSAEIIHILDQQARGWNEGRAELYSEAFAEDGRFTNIFGMSFSGYPIFLQKHDMILNGVFKDSKFEYRLVHLRFINEVAAVVETLITVSGFKKSGLFNLIHTDEAGRMFTRLTQVLQKKNDIWKIVSYQNVDVKEGVTIPELL